VNAQKKFEGVSTFDVAENGVQGVKGCTRWWNWDVFSFL